MYVHDPVATFQRAQLDGRAGDFFDAFRNPPFFALLFVPLALLDLLPAYAGRFFILPEGIVLDDIAAQVERGATHVTFGDPDFLNGPLHGLRIVRKMHEAHPTVTFDFTAKVEHLLKHRALLPELAELGLSFVVSAVESLSDVVLARLAKGHTRDDVERLFDLVQATSITLRPSFVAFTPWTSLTGYFELSSGPGDTANVENAQTAILAMFDQASLALIPAQARTDPGFNFRVIAGLLSDVQKEYAESVKDGKIAQLPEYQNSFGFCQVARAR